MEPRTQGLLSNPTLPIPDHVRREQLPPAADAALPDERSLLVVGRHVDARVFPEVVDVEVIGQLRLQIINRLTFFSPDGATRVLIFIPSSRSPCGCGIRGSMSSRR